MSLRFLSDQCVPGEITNHLRQRGHNLILLREVLPIRSPDELVMAKAKDFVAFGMFIGGCATKPEAPQLTRARLQGRKGQGDGEGKACSNHSPGR